MGDKTNRRRRNYSSHIPQYEKVVRQDFKAVKARNGLILDTFRTAGYRLRLTGNHQFPNFVFSDSFRVPIIIRNEELVVYKKFNDHDEILANVPISECTKDWLRSDFLSYIDGVMERKNVYKVKDHAEQYLVNYGNRWKPGFTFCSARSPLIFLTEDYAKKIIQELMALGVTHPLQVV